MPIPHYAAEPDKVWGELLRGKLPRVRHRALLDIDGDGGGHPAAIAIEDGEGDAGMECAMEGGSDDADSAASEFDFDAALEALIEEPDADLDPEATPVPDSPAAVDEPPPLPPPLSPLRGGGEDLPLPLPLPAAEPPEVAPRPPIVLVAGVRERWGAFRLSHLRMIPESRPFGSFEASCPFHRKNDKTGCKRMFRIWGDRPEDVDRAHMAARWWCARAKDHDRQWYHMRAPIDYDILPVREMIDAAIIVEGPDDVVETDEVLDAMAAAAGGEAAAPAEGAEGGEVIPGRGRGGARGCGARGRGAGRGRAGRAAGRGRGEAVACDASPAASGGDETSDSSHSSSSSVCTEDDESSSAASSSASV